MQFIYSHGIAQAACEAYVSCEKETIFSPSKRQKKDNRVAEVLKVTLQRPRALWSLGDGQ